MRCPVLLLDGAWDLIPAGLRAALWSRSMPLQANARAATLSWLVPVLQAGAQHHEEAAEGEAAEENEDGPDSPSDSEVAAGAAAR